MNRAMNAEDLTVPLFIDEPWAKLMQEHALQLTRQALTLAQSQTEHPPAVYMAELMALATAASAASHGTPEERADPGVCRQVLRMLVEGVSMYFASAVEAENWLPPAVGTDIESGPQMDCAGFLKAHQVEVSHCVHGAVTISLLCPDGSAFAYCHFDRDAALSFASDVHARAINGDPDAPREEGHLH